MSEPQQVFRLRLTFAKQGRLAMLSHLEVARALERTVRRAGLPYAVSQGFSPHMLIAFGAALPVGVGGTHEIADVRLTHYVSADKALSALQEASVADLMVKDCRYIEPKAAAASVAFPVSTYRALLSCTPAVLPLPDEIHVVRKKKEKVLHPAEFLVGDFQLTGAVATFKLEAKPTGSLRPDLLLREAVDNYNLAASGEIVQGVTWVENAVAPEAMIAKKVERGLDLPCCASHPEHHANRAGVGERVAGCQALSARWLSGWGALSLRCRAGCIEGKPFRARYRVWANRFFEKSFAAMGQLAVQ